jgi:nitrite reductase (NADH) large subunit
MNRLKYLIIGSGPAGIFAAEAIRMRDQEGTIVMVSEDRMPAHSPVMLTYWMAGNLARERLLFRDSSWAEKKRIHVRRGSRVVSLDTTFRKITLIEGHEIPYDRLLIATGASPIFLPLPGKEGKGVSSLRHLRDAEAILQGGSDPREVAIIGGGFVGLKLACHLKERGLRVLVFEKEPRLAVRMFDQRVSRLVEEKLREGGIWVETSVEVIEILNDGGWVTGVRLKDGRTFSCQRVIEAVGVKPNTGFLTRSGIDLRGGVLVNERMETNISGIYAAGDVAITTDSITSEWVNNATWPAATRQGRVAGWNMAGGERAYLHNFNLNAINLFGLQVMAAGHSHPFHPLDSNDQSPPGLEIFKKEEKESYKKIVIRSGRAIGFILVGDVSGAGFLLSLITRGDELPPNHRDRLISSKAPSHDLPPHFGFDHGSLFDPLTLSISPGERDEVRATLN